MFIADAHCDTLYKMTIEKRALEDCKVAPARMEKGGLCLQTYAMFVGAKGPAGTPYEDGKRMLAMSEHLAWRFCAARFRMRFRKSRRAF